MPNISIELTVPKDDMPGIVCQGVKCRVGLLGPFVLRVCELQLPAGTYSIRVREDGTRTYSARPLDRGEQKRADTCLRDLVAEAVEFARAVDRALSEGRVVEQPGEPTWN